MTETPRTIVVATSNEKKVAEIRQELGELPGINLVSLAEIVANFGLQLTEPVENGDSFQANAKIKAESYLAQFTAHSIPVDGVLAEDSGFMATALSEHAQAQGLPEPMGLHTKRFYGDANGQDKTKKILTELEKAQEAGFSSTEGIFTAAMILILQENEEVIVYDATGHMTADLTTEPVWNPEDPKNTFAIDPIAIPHNQQVVPPVTLSEYRRMDDSQRAETGIVTHRAQAIANVRRILLGTFNKHDIS